MSEPQRTWQTVAGLLLLCFLLYFWDLGQIPFYDYEESGEAQVSQELRADRGDERLGHSEDSEEDIWDQ